MRGCRDAVWAGRGMRSLAPGRRLDDDLANHPVNFVSRAKIAVAPRLRKSVTEPAPRQNTAGVEWPNTWRTQGINLIPGSRRIVTHRMAHLAIILPFDGLAGADSGAARPIHRLIVVHPDDLDGGPAAEVGRRNLGVRRGDPLRCWRLR